MREMGAPKYRYTISCLSCGDEFEWSRITRKRNKKNCNKPGCAGQKWPGWVSQVVWVEETCRFCGSWRTVGPDTGKPCNDSCASARFLDEKEKAEKRAKAQQDFYNKFLTDNGYPESFTPELKEEIRERQNRRCFLCGEIEGERRLDVHHIDYERKNSSESNLVALCRGCHVMTIRSKKRWPRIFQNLLSK